MLIIKIIIDYEIDVDYENFSIIKTSIDENNFLQIITNKSLQISKNSLKYIYNISIDDEIL